MKNKFYFLAALLLHAAVAGAQAVPTGDFESWDASNVVFMPVPTGWTTNAASIFPKLLQQVSDAHGGSSAAKIGAEKFNGTMLTGTLTCRFGFSTANPTSLTVWLKPSLQGGDSFFVNPIVWGFHNGTFTMERGGTKSIHVSDNSNTWFAVTVPMAQLASDAPDSAYIGLGFYSGVTDTNSYVLMDDMSFDGMASAISETAEVKGSSIENLYPNPANDIQYLVYNIDNASEVSVMVYDLLGNKVLQVLSEKQNTGRYRAEIPVSQLANGLYVEALHVNNETEQQKVLVQH